jgi:transcriptional regulator with XRE-family HTH domain
MKNEQSLALGAMLKNRRKELGFSLSEVAAAANVPPSTVMRFERGAFTAPSPDKLADFARHLRISLADVFATAGYIVPSDLPTFEAYLTTRYPDLPKRAVSQLSHLFVALAEEHLIQTDPTENPPGELIDDLAGGIAG